MVITNKDVIQSYLITAARYDFDVHEQRILFRLVEMCQNQLLGQKLDSNFRIDRTLFGDYSVTMPVSAFLKDEEDKNHALVKDAMRRLRNKTIELEDDKVWKLIGIIEKPVFDKRGFVQFDIQPEIFDAILNFSKGYRKYELKTAMSFDTVYAMRFYELFSEKTGSIAYSIDKLKIMFNIEKKYKLTSDFTRYVVDAAKKELDQKAPFSFTYEVNSRTGKKVISLMFHIYKIAKNRDETLEQNELQKQIALSWDLDKMVIDYLQQNYMFNKEGIRNNLETFKEADKILDLMLFLSKKKRKANDAPNPQGYIIKALKGEIADKKAKGEKLTEKIVPSDPPVDANMQKRVLKSMAKIGKI